MVLKYLALNRADYFCFLKTTGRLLLETELERETYRTIKKEETEKVSSWFHHPDPGTQDRSFPPNVEDSPAPNGQTWEPESYITKTLFS